MITVRKPDTAFEWPCSSCGVTDSIAIISCPAHDKGPPLQLCPGCVAVLSLGVGRIVADCKNDQAEVYKEPA